ncbi:hypothetical protein OUZ56_009770 [Daphnia magna]|uniref:DUF659 domain-containing protein n=1 Tax=Daphnia magna TaxID=35525 RepID=A0ABR0AGV9_9CRUS|nr:hypothetical protein OUZ56_009770 [Daphnia magna]
MSEKPKRDARLHDIVDAIDISETQQHLIDEEDTDVAEETSEEVEADMLRKDPPEEYKQYNPVSSKDLNQPSLLSFNVQPTKTTKQRQIKLDTELALKFAVDNIPLNILRRPRFRQWVESGMNGYQLAGIDRMRNKLMPSVMDKTRLKVMKILQASTSFTIILMVLRHTAENILAEYNQVLHDWNISRSKVAMVKTDGGSNMVANIFVNNIPGWNDEEQFSIEIQSYIRPWHQQEQAVSGTYGRNFEVSTTDDDNENEEDPLLQLFKEMGVSNEMMEAAVQDVEKKGEFQDVEGEAALVISHVSKLINYVRKSVLDTEMVFNAVGFRLTAKNATRWNSTYFMMMKFLRAIDKDPTLCSRLNAVKSMVL